MKLLKISGNYYNPEATDDVRPKGACCEVLLRGGQIIDAPLNPDQFEKAVREDTQKAEAVLVSTKF